MAGRIMPTILALQRHNQRRMFMTKQGRTQHILQPTTGMQSITQAPHRRVSKCTRRLGLVPR